MTVVADINGLKQDQQISLRAARKIRDKATGENRSLTPSELEQINGHMDEFDTLQTSITTLERMEGIDPARRLINGEVDAEPAENGSTVPDSTRAETEDHDADDGDEFQVRWDDREDSRAFRDMSIVQERAYLHHARTLDYNSAFYSMLRGRGFRGPQAQTLEHMRTLVEGVDLDGGFLAPTQLVAGIVRESQEYEELKPRTEIIRSNARSLTYTKGLDNIQMGWVAELGTKPVDQPTFGRVVLVPHVGAVVIWVSDELLEDESFGLQGYLQTLVSEAKVLLEEEAFVSGSGSGRPWGILTRLNGLAGTPQRFATTTAGQFTAQDVLSVPYTLPPRYRRQGTWILGTAAIRAIRLQREDGANGAYIWQPGLQAGQPSTLDGYPVVESSAAALNAGMTTGNDIGIFGNLRRYRVFERLGLQVKRLEELRALTDEVGFRFRFRTGGDVTLNEAFKTIRVG